jgi:hypothetical protein
VPGGQVPAAERFFIEGEEVTGIVVRNSQGTNLKGLAGDECADGTRGGRSGGLGRGRWFNSLNGRLNDGGAGCIPDFKVIALAIMAAMIVRSSSETRMSVGS